MPRIPSRSLALIAIVSLLALFITAIAAAASSPGSLSFTSADYSVVEGAGNASITLSRSGGSDGAVTAKVAITGGTASASDYRLNPGALDSAFNIGTGPVSEVEAIAVQPDGKILIGGIFWAYNGVARNSIARLNTDGSLDTTFVPPAVTSDVFCMALQPDGKILIGGVVSHNGGVDKRTGIARLNPDGSPDTTFNPGTGTGGYGVETIALQPDGKILIGGKFPSYNGAAHPNVAQLNSDGSIDTSFDAGSGTGYGFITQLIVQPDGKILAGGDFTDFNGHSVRAVARLNVDGSYDATFNPGTALDKIGVVSMALQPDGKLLVGGYFYTNAAVAANQTPLVRFNSDGSLDGSFTDPGLGTRYRINCMTLQPDGKVLVGGSIAPSTPGQAVSQWLDRLNANGSDDATFHPAITAFTNSATVDIALQGDGRILVGGQFTQDFQGNTYRNLWRLEGDLFVTWGAGDSADKTVKLPIVQDFLHEEDETLNLTLTPLAGGATAGAVPDATLTILDDDGLLGFGSPTYSVSEGAGSASIPVTLVGRVAGTATVGYSISSGSAANGSDFTGSTGTLTFAQGETSKNISVPILDDNINERDETVIINMTSVTGGLVGLNNTVLTIQDDDPLPTIAVDDVTVTEGDTGGKQVLFTVTRTGLIDRAVSFTARTADGTAVAGEDYTALNNTFQISPSVNSASVSVSVNGDTLIEPDKSFFLNLTSPVNATITRAQGTCVIKDNDTTTGVPTVQFNARELKVNEGAGAATVTVTRSGDASAPTAVSYSTSSFNGIGAASDRRDYTVVLGTLQFAAGETSKTFQVFVTDDAFVEGDETFSVTLNGATGGTSVGNPFALTLRIIDNDTAQGAPNPVDDSSFFVRQHYVDFLNREPDVSGLAFWTGEIEKCGQDAQCREVKRVNVSAAFFLSIEFQQTGYFVYLLNKAAFNAGERLNYRTFLGDTQEIGRGVVVGDQGWEQKLSTNKQAFADAFVARVQFTSAFPSTMTPAQFVDALNANTGDPLNPSAGNALTQAERDQLVADLTAGAKTRAQALRAVAENGEFQRRQNSKAFVLMQYFGYLRRAPNDTPDSNFDGYNFWLSKLNQFGGNFVAAEMVKAFISAPEYRQRFGQ